MSNEDLQEQLNEDVESAELADATPDTDPGIEEIREVLKAMQEVAGEAGDLVQGQTGVREFGTAAVDVLPGVYEAAQDLDEIPEEISDLDSEEVEALADEALKIVTSFTS